MTRGGSSCLRTLRVRLSRAPPECLRRDGEGRVYTRALALRSSVQTPDTASRRSSSTERSSGSAVTGHRSSSPLGAVAEEDRAVAETAFVQQLEVQADVVVREETLTPFHHDRHE